MSIIKTVRFHVAKKNPRAPRRENQPSKTVIKAFRKYLGILPRTPHRSKRKLRRLSRSKRVRNVVKRGRVYQYVKLKRGEKFVGKARTYGYARIKRRLRKNPVHGSEPGDRAAAHELFLHAVNDADLYRQQIQHVILNLQRKIAKGIYDESRAWKLWRYVADNAAKTYTHGGTGWGKGKGFGIFNVSTRELTAKELAKHYASEVHMRKNPKSRAFLHAKKLYSMPDVYRSLTKKEQRRVMRMSPINRERYLTSRTVQRNSRSRAFLHVEKPLHRPRYRVGVKKDLGGVYYFDQVFASLAKARKIAQASANAARRTYVIRKVAA